MDAGLLIMNGFVKEPGFLHIRDSLLAAAERQGVELECRGHDELLFDAVNTLPLFDIGRYSYGIFWDKDVALGGLLEAAGLRLFNSARAVAVCDDKFLTHCALAGRLPMPKTVAVPMTYRFVGYGGMEFLRRAAGYIGFPMVIKERCGSFGKQVYLANSMEEAEAILTEHEAAPMIMQRAVQEAFGRDVRIYVVGGRVVASMLRTNPTDFRANVANGGETRPYTPTPLETELALRAAECLGLDFAGVDLLESREGPLICEVNSNAHFRGIERCTGADVAGAIIRHTAALGRGRG